MPEKAFIINGIDVTFDMLSTDKIKKYRDMALDKTNNIGREYCEWEIHDDAGALIEPNTLVKNIESERLFLNLSVGYGGEA